MSARQNKKQRKGRGNVHQRERTVTTLTEDPNTHYLVPTPSEEPAHMYNNNQNQKLSFPNYPYPYQQQQPFISPAQHQQPQSQTPMKPTLPPGKNDLEILQNLKKIIKDGQHPYFRAVPQPAALASIYLGTIPSQSQAQTRRGETPGDSAEGRPTVERRPRMPGATLQANNNASQATEATQHGNSPATNNLVTSLNLASLKINKNTPGPASATFQPESRTSDPTNPTPQINKNTPGPASASFQPESRASDSTTPTPEVIVSDLQRRYDYSARSRDLPVMGERGDWQQNDRDRRPLQPPSFASSHDHSQAKPVDDRGRPFTPAELRQYSAASTHYETQGPSDDPSGMHVDDRLSAATVDDRRGRPPHAPDYAAPGDPRPNPGDSRPQPDSRGEPGSSRGPSDDSRSERGGSGVVPPARASTSDRIVPPQSQTQPPAAVVPTADVDDIQSSRASSLRPTDVATQILASVPSPSEEGMIGGGRSDMPLEDNGPRPSLKDRLIPPRSAGRASSEHPSHYGDYPGPNSRRPKFYKDKGGGASFDGPPRPSDRGPSGFGTPPGNGGPMPGSGGPTPRSFHAHSPPPDGRGAKPLSTAPGVTHRPPIRGPPLGRPMGRDDRGGYRAEYDPRRPDVLDDTMVRYGDRSYRDFSPPLGEIPRGGRPAPFPPSPGRVPLGGDGRRSEWQYQQYPPSPGVPQNWGIEEEWDRSGDRDRFERDIPPRSAGWDYRGEREFIARDGYSSAPLDDRGYPSRDTDRGRPPGPYPPSYGRVRPRSPSPIRRNGSGSMDDSRPPMKRAREEFPPTGYYSPHAPPPVGNRDGPGPIRRPPGEYAPPPPRSGSSGPPSSASSWPPPPPSGGSSTGGPPSDRDRDYRMGRDGMDFPPPSAGYDRPRSPGPLGRHSYGRGGGGGGYGRGDPRDRGGYGMPPRP